MGLRSISTSAFDRKHDSYSGFTRCPHCREIAYNPPADDGRKFNPNPNPSNYVIKKSLQVGEFLVVKIKYPDCENYEGIKILVYDRIELEHLHAQKFIDPHFSENKKYYSPIARFEPTDEGWKMAIVFCKAWSLWCDDE